MNEPATKTIAPAGVFAGAVRRRVAWACADVAPRIDTSSAKVVLLGRARGGCMKVDIEIENPVGVGDRRTLQSVFVDAGAQLSWFPAPALESLGIARIKLWHFRQRDGSVLARWTGGVIVRVIGVQTWDEVVFGEPGDLVLLGARSLEGLNLRVDPVTMQLIDAGPAPAAATCAA